MSFFSSWSIARRLYGVSGLVALSLLGLILYAWVALGDVESLAERTGDLRVPQLQRMAALELNVTRVSLQLRHAMLARTPAERDAALADIGEKRKLLEQALSAYEKSLFTAAGRERFARIPPLVARFWELGEANIRLIQQGQREEAFAFLVDKTIPARNALLAELSDTVKFQQEQLSAELATIKGEAAMTLKALLALVAAIVGGLALASWAVVAALHRRVAVACEVAARVRDGRLDSVVHDDARDEFSPLLAALRDMQGALIGVVAEVRRNAESVATASAQIAQGNEDLSSRTEEQASALQQTAATMDQLGTAVQHNAGNAQQASQLAHGASDIASRGGAVVGQVVQTMQGISEASREIKALIGSSVERVEQGSALVGRAGATMEEIVAAIRRVSDIVAEISAASSEQSSGVGQVVQAVSQMDQATQQNAALVEESAAAAESLKQQAQRLVDAVAVFRLP